MIDHLKEIDDPLVKMFKIKELLPIKSNSLYHSPEISEMDDENPGQRKIVTRDLKWRSSIVRNIIDKYSIRNFHITISDISIFVL